MGQALVDELTRIAVAKIDEWRSELLSMVERLGREEAERVVREKFKVPPMVIGAGLWHAGFHYCREKEPACDICPIACLCPKHV